MGGKLVEPRKQTTNDFITDVAKEKGNGIELWIGINDISKEGVFVYESNSEPVTWTNWGPGEPNNGGNGLRNGDCVRLKQEEWWDLNCDYSKPFVCERGIHDYK